MAVAPLSGDRPVLKEQKAISPSHTRKHLDGHAYTRDGFRATLQQFSRVKGGEGVKGKLKSRK